MGEAEILPRVGRLNIHSILHFYGDAASPALAAQIASDISQHWNEPAGGVFIQSELFAVHFIIEGIYVPGLPPETVWQATDPRFNFFRIEEFAVGNISFVDGIGCNTGYFKLDNLLHGSTTAAHEYGHTLGLQHPAQLDIRGTGQPGIMYPRGTICDPEFQYDPGAQPLAPGGTLNPFKRKVLPEDIEQLRLDRLRFVGNKAVLGEWTSLYHARHGN